MKSKVCGETRGRYQTEGLWFQTCDADDYFLFFFFLQNILTDFILSHLNNENKQQQQMK